MFQTFILQAAFFYFLHPVYIIITAAYNTNDIFSFDGCCIIIQCRNAQRSGRFNYNSIFVIQL